MTLKWYATLHHPKMYPHIKFGIPTSKSKGDMHRTRSGTDGRTHGRMDGQCDYYMPPKVPLVKFPLLVERNFVSPKIPCPNEFPGGFLNTIRKHPRWINPEKEIPCA